MLNHRRPKQTSWFYSDEKEGFIIEALEDLNRGEQVCDSYGKKCNSRFFLNYGFINLDNDANEVALRVSFDSDDETLSMKEKMVGESVTTKSFRILASTEEENTIEFMNYIRFTEIRDKSVLLELMVIACMLIFLSIVRIFMRIQEREIRSMMDTDLKRLLLYQLIWK